MRNLTTPARSRNWGSSGCVREILLARARLYALSARTGEILWQAALAEGKKGYSTTAGPIVIHGKVLNGLTGCGQYREEGCFISAYDAATGKQLWKFRTTAREGEPGGDTWGQLPNLFRAGSASCSTSYLQYLISSFTAAVS